MRLVRFGEKGKEKPGLLKGQNLVDLTLALPGVPDIGPEFFEGGFAEKAAAVTDVGKPFTGRLASPVTRPEKIICLGKNYADHAKEGNMSVPEKPLLFCKTANTLNGPFDAVVLPKSSGQIDWEVELALVIGKGGKAISSKDALNHIAGYCVFNDVSARQAQFSDKQWFRGKSFDTFAPMGPCLVSPDEIEDIDNLTLEARVNGDLMQQGSTADLLFKIPFLIEFISADITLKSGDIISTGTPAGVGIFRNPPVVLCPGDVVECSILPIGSIKNRFV
ncbi:MAG: fumarylacetoacetate hydrolase family protein [Desulfatibacillaceae bacterium]|nr:fumarylacetoacetate hydrolase family protein [Desulfatibacillaceae bacterium]